MDIKLTLKLDDGVIERAKTYARKKNTSISQLVETYLNFLTSSGEEVDDTTEVTPLVKSLSGIIDLPKDSDIKKNYKNHILKKYSK